MHLRASGTSMFPFIREGDVLLIDECITDNLHTADIAVYKIEGKSFAHRVLWNAKDFLFLKADTHFSVEKIHTSEITGKLKAITRNGRVIDLSAGLSKFFSLLCFFCLLPISFVYNLIITLRGFRDAEVS